MEVKYTIKELNKKYFQKSAFFLYPLLKIPKVIIPIDTYIQWDDYFSLNEHVLICRFKKFTKDLELDVEKHVLLSHPLYKDYHELEDGTVVYIFSLANHKDLMKAFLIGKYSKLSEKHKQTIIQFFKEGTYTRSYLKSYLYPDDFYEIYSILLEMSIETLKEIGELASPPDLKKENLTLKMKDLNITLAN